ncbi:MAG: PAS domain S-box protein [Bacteroidales bacterium]|nr:PAS domain S-box protein [Bacteroidales bacterium]
MDFNQELTNTREQIINKAIQGAAIVILPTVVLSLIRFLLTGWHHIFYVHLLIFVCTLLLLSLRNRLMTGVKMHFLVFIVLMISVSALCTYTLTGGSFLFFAMIFIPLMLYSKRWAIAYSVIYLSAFFIIARLFHSGVLSPVPDFNSYLLNFFIWTAHGIMYALVLFYIGYMLNMYYRLYKNVLASAIDYSQELQRSLETVDYQKNRFKLFMDAYPFHATIKDENKTFVFGNKAILDYVNVSKEVLSGLNPGDVFSEEIARQLDRMDNEVLDKKAHIREEIKTNRDKEGFKCFDVIKFPLFSPDNKVLIGSISIDITRQKEAEKRILESEIKYRTIFEGSNDGMIFLDEDLKISDCNHSYCELVGYSKEELLGQDYKITIHDKETDWDSIILSLAAHNRIDSRTIELEGIRKDGQLIRADVAVYKRIQDEKEVIWAVVRDLREKKMLEEEIFRTMVRSEEAERSRFAKELHDGLGPLLSTSLIYLHTMGKEQDMDKTHNYANRVYQLIDEAASSIREISNNISPDILAKYGLMQAIRSFCEKVKLAREINFSINTNLMCRLDDTIEFTIYRILTELINNTIKHAKASAVQISINKNDDMLLIGYSDDGEGFDYTSQKKDAKGFGLVNLENRIEKLGGHFLYYSEPGRGVRADIRLKTKCI